LKKQLIIKTSQKRITDSNEIDTGNENAVELKIVEFQADLFN
jgi:hypothetical protein